MCWFSSDGVGGSIHPWAGRGDLAWEGASDGRHPAYSPSPQEARWTFPASEEQKKGETHT